MSLFKKINTKNQELNLVQDNIDKFATATEQAMDQVGASFSVAKLDSGTKNYTVTTSDRYILASPSYGNIKVALPQPAQEQLLTVKNKIVGDGVVLVQVDDGQDIDGTNQIQLRSYEFLTLFCDGSTWTKVG